MHPETRELIQRLILSAVSNIEAWEHWAEIVPIGPAQKMHQSLIRLVKGMIKAFRLRLLEDQNHIQSSRVIPPPSVTSKEASNGRSSGQTHVL